MFTRKSCSALVKGFAGGMFVAAMLLATPVPAKIDLVTLPARDETQLTIYNSQDLTLVRETRTLSFTPGNNEIQFSWANTLIDPTSLQIDIKDNPGLVVTDAVYPANSSQLIVWNIEAEEETSAEVEITYFTSGLTWAADYIIKADKDLATFELQQFTTVRNASGEDFDNAVTRVVVGEVNLIDLIAELARRGITVDQDRFAGMLGREIVAKDEARREPPMAAMMGAPSPTMLEEAKAIIKKAVSEYYLFAVEGKETILNGWGKELPNPKVGDIPFDLSYEIDPRKYGNGVVKFYKLKNDVDHKLGEDPLPDGTYYVYSDDGRGGLRFEGTTSSKYIPIGEDIELNLGDDGMVLFETRLMDVKRDGFEYGTDKSVIGWEETRTIELEIKNSRDRDVPLKLTYYFSGDWEIKDSSRADYDRVDKETVRWEFDLAARATETIRLEVTFRMGTRARNN